MKQLELDTLDRAILGASDDESLIWLAIVNVRVGGEVTANLLAPIVISPERRTGRQVMPHNCIYPLNHVITPPK